MKRLLAVLLILVLVLGLSACGNKNDGTKTESTKAQDSTKTQETEEKTEEASTKKSGFDDLIDESESAGEEDLFTLKEIPEEIKPTSKKITVWMWGDNEEFYKYYDGFLADYPEYELDFQVVAGDSQQLLEAVTSGVGIPDAVLVGARPADAYYTGLYQSIDKYIDLDPNYKREDINDMALAGNTFGGKTYFVCEDLELCALGWNKTLFAEAGLDPENPPKTYSEFEQYSKALTQYNADGEATQIGYFGTIGYWALSSAMGHYVTQSDGFTVEFDIPEIHKSFAFSKSVPTFYNNKLANADDGEYWASTSGHTGFFYVNCKHISDFISEDMDAGICPWPVADDYEGEQYICVYSSQQYGIPVKCSNPNGGWLFIRWLVTKGIGEVYNEEMFANNPNGYIPQYQSNKKIREAVRTKYYDLITNEKIKDLWDKRDAMYDQANMFLWSDVIESVFHPNIWTSEEKIYADLVTITDQCAKIQKLGVRLHEQWIQEKLADGWTWTEDKSALIPPETK